MADTLDEIQPIFRDILDQPDLKITRKSDASSIEGWDSLAHVNLITAIEKRFRISFALGELQELKNVGEMVDLINIKVRPR
jgi:acyl carrier protein